MTQRSDRKGWHSRVTLAKAGFAEASPAHGIAEEKAALLQCAKLNRFSVCTFRSHRVVAVPLTTAHSSL